MDLALASWGYGLAPLRLGIWTGHPLSPNSPSLMRFGATRCIHVRCETGTLSWVHGDTFSVSAAKHQFLLPVSSYLFCYLLWS